jgi:hypothetical protein
MSIRKANASRFVIPHPLLYLPYRVLSFTYFIYYIPESDKRGVCSISLKRTLAIESAG